MFNRNRKEIFSFRKFKNGRTDSALIGATVLALGMSLLASHGVSASEVVASASEVAPNTAISAPSEVRENNEVVVQPKSEVGVEEVVQPNKVETKKNTEASPKLEETPKVEEKETKEVSLDKSQLESYVSTIEGNLASGAYSNKTEESLALLGSDLASARGVLASATSQVELTSAYNKLVTTVNSKLKNKPVEKKEVAKVDTTEGKETIGIKAENTNPSSEDKVGSKDERNGKAMNEGSGLRSATEGYTFETTEKRHENGEFSTNLTGKSYEVLDKNPNYKLYVHGYQSENTDLKSNTNEVAATGGRTDVPLSKEEARKLSNEAKMWKGKPRPTGVDNRANHYGAGGSYEFLATEIYGYTYEQGKHYVYVPDVKKRFTLSQEAQGAGYRITNIDIHNLLPGLGYNEKTDTIEGYVSASIQNGVYDMRYDVTITKPDNTTQKFSFADLKAGWMGWQDTTPPTIEGSSTMVKIGDTISHNLNYLDNPGIFKDNRANYHYAERIEDPVTKEVTYKDTGERVHSGSRTQPNNTKISYFTAQDGTRILTGSPVIKPDGSRTQMLASPAGITAHTTLNGVYTGNEATINDVVPGLSYNPKTGLITGTATEAGIFTMAAQAKDYNNTTNARNRDWNAYGQETHENITIAVTPKVTISNVEAYSTSVPVTISNGANTAEITMPDGTVTKLAVKNGKWVIAEGTTNTAVTVGTELGEASNTTPFQFNLAVTSNATQYAGVDTIVAKSTTDRVKANLQREVVTVRDADGQTHTATFNRATGKFQLPNNEAYVVTENTDGTTTLKERRVYTDLKADGDIDFIVYEFTRTWTSHSSATNLVDKVEEIRKTGEVKAVGDVTRTVTTVPKDQTANTEGVIVTVTYDSVSGTWSASDGSKVTATESNAGWSIETSSGFKGYVSYRSAIGHDVGSIQNAKPVGSSIDYEAKKNSVVDLLKSPKANVGFTDVIDDKSTDEQSETIVTKLTVTAPDGSQKVFDTAQAEETAYIQAQRTQAEKNKLAVEAVKSEQGAKNELARLQELIDRQVQYNADAQSSLDNLRLRTISVTAKELAESRLNEGKAELAKLQAELATKQGDLPSLQSKVTETRTAALESEKAVEVAREALKVAAKKNLENAELTAYKLSQVGQYTVTVHAVDSNGIVTTPTLGGDDSGEVTEDAVTETTYHITVPRVQVPVRVNHYKDGTTEKLAPSEDKGLFDVDDNYTTNSATIPPRTEVEETPEKTITRVVTYTLKETPSDANGIVPDEGKVVDYYYVEHVETTEVAKKAPVIANYYIENTTTKLAPSDDQGQKDIGSKYTTETKVIEPVVETEDLLDRVVTKTTRYELVSVPSDKEGSVPVEGKVVDYYYRPVVTTETVMKKAPVLVNYYLENTTEKLAPSDDQGQKEIGSKYTSEIKVIPPKVEVEELPNKTVTKTTTYELVAVPSDKEGTVPVEGKVVNYYYRPVVSSTETPKQAPVIVHHLLEGTTTKLADDENQGLKNIDSNYTTNSATIPPKVEVQELPDRTVTKTTTYELVSDPTDKNGTVPPEGKEVTYYYRPVVKEDIVKKQAPVVVNHYEDGTTTKLADSVDKGKFDIGSGYTTESATIPPKVEVQELPNKTVTTITTWTLKAEPSDKNGTVPAEGKVVNYYYVKSVDVKEVKKQAPVTVNYYKDGTTTSVSPSENQGKKDIGSKYTTEPKTIPPVTTVEETPEKTITRTTTYVLKAVPSDKDGKVPSEGKVVNYYYVEKVTVNEVPKKAPVVSNYYIEGTTTKLAKSENQEGKDIKSKYTTEVKVIEPKKEVQDLPDRVVTKITTYELVRVPSDKDGLVPAEGKVVNYYYRPNVTETVVMKKAPLTVNFLLEGTRKELHKPLTKPNQVIKSPYSVNPLPIEPTVERTKKGNIEIIKTTRYELIGIPKNSKGLIDAGGTVVDFFYRPVVTVEEYPTVPNEAPKVTIPEYKVPTEPTKPIEEIPTKPTPKPEEPKVEVPKESPKVELVKQQVSDQKAELPNTGMADSMNLSALGVLNLVGLLGLLGLRKSKREE